MSVCWKYNPFERWDVLVVVFLKMHTVSLHPLSILKFSLKWNLSSCVSHFSFLNFMFRSKPMLVCFFFLSDVEGWGYFFNLLTLVWLKSLALCVFIVLSLVLCCCQWVIVPCRHRAHPSAPIHWGVLSCPLHCTRKWQHLDLINTAVSYYSVL